MEYRRLGKTGLDVSILGFGAMRLDGVPEMEAVKALRLAIESGINMIHTSPTYGDSARRVAKAIDGLREGVILNVKIFGSSGEKAREQLDLSFEMLDTDTIDIAQFRITEDLFDQGISESGGFGVLQEAMDRGSVRHIGITDHDPAFLSRAIRMVPVSNVLCPFNHVFTRPLEELVPAADKMDVGFSAMKVLGRGKLKDVPTALSYVLGKGATTAIIGMSTIREVEANLAAIEAMPHLSPGLEEELAARSRLLLGRYDVRNGALVERTSRNARGRCPRPGCPGVLESHMTFCPVCGAPKSGFKD
jgi:aryl-alcohol dehydrogenase-like predicted oxidoreductase